MRIIQVVESFTYGDAIGDHVLALHKAFLERGIQAKICASYIENRMKEWAEPYDSYEPEQGDRIILHMSIGSPLNIDVTKHGCELIVDYHNITPPEFFEGYNERLAECCRLGREQLKELAPHADLAVADSAYNAQELVDAGFTCPVHVAPILLDFSKYATEPDAKVMREQAKKTGAKLLFVGRVVPNKRHELVIQAFYEYKRLYDPQATLTFVGGYRGSWPYFLRLRKYARKLSLKGVRYAGHVKFEEMIAYYQSADVFVCESSHEGFCVPLIESMYYRLPVVAYDACAVGETLGEGGIHLPDQLPQTAAEAIHRVVSDPELQQTLKSAQEEELKRFDHDHVLQQHFTALGL